jgi:hypothetical protein
VTENRGDQFLMPNVTDLRCEEAFVGERKTDLGNKLYLLIDPDATAAGTSDWLESWMAEAEMPTSWGTKSHVTPSWLRSIGV